MTPMGHDEAQAQLGALVDGELGERAAARVRLHLDACEACRRAAALQRAVRARVRDLVLPPAAPGLQARLAAAVAPFERERRTPRARPPAGATLARSAVLWSGWAAAAVLAAILALGRAPHRAALAEGPRPPMVVAALADYRRVMRDELPAGCDPSAAPGLPFRASPLHAPGARPLSCWATTVQGQPASAWAYRWRDRVVVAYVVPEALFFRQPAVRDAVAREGRYAAADGAEGVLAWPCPGGGVLVIATAAPADLDALRL